jgi:hypothetical protein
MPKEKKQSKRGFEPIARKPTTKQLQKAAEVLRLAREHGTRSAADLQVVKAIESAVAAKGRREGKAAAVQMQVEEAKGRAEQLAQTAKARREGKAAAVQMQVEEAKGRAEQLAQTTKARREGKAAAVQMQVEEAKGRAEQLAQTARMKRAIHKASIQALKPIDQGKRRVDEIIELSQQRSITHEESMELWRHLQSIMDFRVEHFESNPPENTEELRVRAATIGEEMHHLVDRGIEQMESGGLDKEDAQIFIDLKDQLIENMALDTHYKGLGAGAEKVEDVKPDVGLTPQDVMEIDTPVGLKRETEDVETGRLQKARRPDVGGFTESTDVAVATIDTPYAPRDVMEIDTPVGLKRDPQDIKTGRLEKARRPFEGDQTQPQPLPPSVPAPPPAAQPQLKTDSQPIFQRKGVKPSPSVKPLQSIGARGFVRATEEIPSRGKLPGGDFPREDISSRSRPLPGVGFQGDATDRTDRSTVRGTQVAPTPGHPQPTPDTVMVEDEGGRPLGREEEKDGEEDGGGVDIDTQEVDTQPVAGVGEEGADGRDDFLSPDELKTLHPDDFQWRTGDSTYATKESRGKIGYGTRADVQPVEPFGVALVKPLKVHEGDTLIKQAEGGFEPFRGPHVIEKKPEGERREAGQAEQPDIEPIANKPFAKIDGRIIWLPFYGKTARYFFTAQDYQELTSHVVEEGGELKLKAPDQNVFQNMQQTIDSVRSALASFGLLQRRLRHETLVTRHAEWLELKQIMKAIAVYEETTAGEYNTAGLFAGNLREAITKALNDTVLKMDGKTKRGMKRGLEADQRGVQARSTRQRGRGMDDVGGLPPFNPFMRQEGTLGKVTETLPRFF